jgi:hypothetical protein
MFERAAQELAPFLDEVAFVGGATVTLWIADQAAPQRRSSASRNQWQRPALDHAKTLSLPSGRRIRAA